MIRGVHAMFYTSDPAGTRAFFRDKLGFKATDLGHGWLIFDLPEADLGCHPTEKENGEEPPTGTADISFYCDDIAKTMAELTSSTCVAIVHVWPNGSVTVPDRSP